MMHQPAPIMQEWVEEHVKPFNELMISWNAIRPEAGKFLFYVSVQTEEWSPWLLYASWGNDGQSSFLSTTEQVPVKVYQDALEVLEGKKATAFKVKTVAVGNARLEDIYGLHVYTNSDKELSKTDSLGCFAIASIYLDVSGLSQMALDHIRHRDLCSPTSATAVIRYLSHDDTIDPLDVASNVWDSGFDIFGNWVLNVAQASTYLGSGWDCWVERLNGFADIYHYLEEATPVIVSVKGPLSGSAQPYAQGHLLAVIGYDSSNQSVLCMDPAFSKNNETHVSYSLLDFVQAWNRRGNVAYIFKKK